MLRLADRLGRSRGKFAILDCVPSMPPSPQRPDLQRFLASELGVIWIGHATMMLRIGGTTILTDPVFSPRVGIGMGVMTAGPRRRFAPAIRLRDLPPIDLILISHAHFDHLDRPTLAKLPKQTRIITASQTSDLLLDLGFQAVQELRWGEVIDIDSIRVTSIPVAHWGARTFYDQHRGYCGYTLESLTGRPRRVLFGADSAYQEEWKSLPKVDLAVVGIGAYNPYLRAHANPEQAWAMSQFVHAEYVVPMHHSTFKLSHEPWHEPMERLLAAAGSSVDRVVVREVGGQWEG